MLKKISKIEKKSIAQKSKTAEEVVKKPERYLEGIGRRKTAIARVRIYPKYPTAHKYDIVVNDKNFSEYFRTKKLTDIAIASFSGIKTDFKTSAFVFGGGIKAQAEAVRLGMARALVALNPIWRSKLKGLGYLKRDPRMVETKKFGFRKARRPQQWRKR